MVPRLVPVRLVLGTMVAALAGCAPAGRPAGVAATTELSGRTAGPPQRCLPTRQLEGLRLGGDRLVLYGTGRTVWANRLSQDCVGIRQTDVLISEPFGGQYCRGDRLRSFDPISRIPGPGCRLGDFVPYRR